MKNKASNFMKKSIAVIGSFMKKNLLGIIIGAVLVGAISFASASYSFTASNVYYNNSSSGGSSTNVNGAINDLYSRLKYGNAPSSYILSGYTALVNGSKVSGSMTNRGAWTGTVTSGSKIYIPEGYHNGSGYVQGSGTTLSGTKEVSENKTYNIAALGYPETITVDVPNVVMKVKELPYQSFDYDDVGALSAEYIKTVSPTSYDSDDTETTATWNGGAAFALSGTKKDHWDMDVWSYGNKADTTEAGADGNKPSGSTTEQHLELRFSSLSTSSNPRWEDSATQYSWDKLNAANFKRAKAVSVVLKCYKDASTYLQTVDGTEYFYGKAVGSAEPEDVELVILKEPNSYKIKSVTSNYDAYYDVEKKTASWDSTNNNGTVNYLKVTHDVYWEAVVEEKKNSSGVAYIHLVLKYYAPRMQRTQAISVSKRFKTGTSYVEPDDETYEEQDVVGVYKYYRNFIKNPGTDDKIRSAAYSAYKNVLMAPSGYKYVYGEFVYKE